MKSSFALCFPSSMYFRLSWSLFATWTSLIMYLICPSRFCTTSVLTSPGYYSRPKRKTMLMQFFFFFFGGGGIRCVMGNVQVTNLIGVTNYHFSCSTLFLSREWRGCPINATAAGGGGGERRKGKGRMRCSYFPGYQFRIVISQLQVLQISAV